MSNLSGWFNVSHSATFLNIIRKENIVKLSIEEKTIVSRYLSEDMSFKGAIKSYWPWFIPLLGAAVHGVFYEDIISSFIANLLFLFYAYWFLSQGSRDGQNMKSALQKYESEVSALGE